MCFPKFINHLSQTNYTNCIARLQRQKKVEHPGNHFRFVKMKKAPKPYGFSAFCWSEWRDLNSRPLDPQSSALPAAPHPVNADYDNTVL